MCCSVYLTHCTVVVQQALQLEVRGTKTHKHITKTQTMVALQQSVRVVTLVALTLLVAAPLLATVTAESHQELEALYQARAADCKQTCKQEFKDNLDALYEGNLQRKERMHHHSLTQTLLDVALCTPVQTLSKRVTSSLVSCRAPRATMLAARDTTTELSRQRAAQDVPAAARATGTRFEAMACSTSCNVRGACWFVVVWWVGQ